MQTWFKNFPIWRSSRQLWAKNCSGSTFQLDWSSIFNRYLFALIMFKSNLWAVNVVVIRAWERKKSSNPPEVDKPELTSRVDANEARSGLTYRLAAIYNGWDGELHFGLLSLKTYRSAAWRKLTASIRLLQNGKLTWRCVSLKNLLLPSRQKTVQ